MNKFDEMYAQLPFIDSAVRPHYKIYLDWLKEQDPQTMRDRREEAEMIFVASGSPLRCTATKTKTAQAPSDSFPLI